MASTLTVKAIEAARPGPARREIPDGLLTGLYLVIQPGGAKSWAVRYRHAGKPRKLALGPLAPSLPGPEPEPALGAPLTLGGARIIAREQLLQVAAGRDPGAERQAAKVAARHPEEPDRDLVKTVAAKFLERYLKPRAKSSYLHDVTAILNKDVLSQWGERRIQDITRRDVLDLVDGVVNRGARVQANRVLAAVKSLFNWAASRDIIVANPAASVKKPTEETSRDRVLTDEEIRLFWLACGEVAFPFGPMARLMLLTGVRRSEAAGMLRSELSGDGKVWTLPADRTKNSRALAIPLSEAAGAAIADAPIVALSKADLAAGIPRQGKHRDLVFTTNGRSHVSGYARAKKRIDTAMLKIARQEAEARGADPDDVKLTAWTFHDLRRTLVSGMAALGVDLPVIERCINHVSGSFGGVAGVYQRHSFAEEMRVAFATWAAHVEALAAGGMASNVTPLSARRRRK